jgi:GNAT superfamily N-acetyltransferase
MAHDEVRAVTGKAPWRASNLMIRPLAVGERDTLMTMLTREHLPVDGLDDPSGLFWRFDSMQDVPLGFGGIELHGSDALLRSVVTMPPVRHRGIGSAIVTVLETEAAIAGCNAIYVLANRGGLFERHGYKVCEPDRVPRFVAGRGSGAAMVMVKRLPPRAGTTKN